MKKYKIIEGNYDDYVKYNGLKNKNKPVALEIRDNIGTENIFSSFSDFSSFLNEIMDSCS